MTTEYDFSQLNDKEFEVFSCDLIGKRLGATIERFKPGKDSGVDGRFFSNDNKEVILQCKHYVRTGYSGLIRSIKKAEPEKVKKLNPSRYIFITSLSLSMANKVEIMSLFQPFIKREDDIYGREDLNFLLSENPIIEERYFKLWITSTNVLVRLIHNAIKGRSEYEIQRIQEESYRFVETGFYCQALKKLKDNRVVIISGEPGVGKTTLAENLCLFLTSKGYEFIDIEESLSEAEALYTVGKKQAFYFDDFLGSNYFEAISNKKDSHIVKFIERVSSDNNKAFILTTRTNILNIGVIHSPILSNKNLRKNEYLLNVESLSRMDKARILYNHIWFSDLPESFIDELYKEERYLKVIDHPNYNPRLIEYFTEGSRFKGIDVDDYWVSVDEMLRNPRDIWENSFKIQNNDFVRTLVILVVFNKGSIDEHQLRKSYAKYINISGLINSSNTSKDFNTSIKLAVKSFLKRTKIPQFVLYNLFNPSISDYVLNEYLDDIGLIKNALNSLMTYESISNIVSIARGDKLSEVSLREILHSVFLDGCFHDSDFDFQIIVLDQIKDTHINYPGYKDALINLFLNISTTKEFVRVLSLADLASEAFGIVDFSFLDRVLEKVGLDEQEIIELTKFVQRHSIEDEDILIRYDEQADHVLSEMVNDRIGDFDLWDLVTFDVDADGSVITHYNEEKFRKKLHDFSSDIYDEISFKLIDEVEVNIDSIVATIDLEDLAYQYAVSQLDEDDSSFWRRSVPENSDIRDLFDRT